MSIMTSVFIASVVAAICVGLAIADPTAKMTLKKVDVKVSDNPYFGPMEVEIHPPGDTASMKIPVKKDLPETLMMGAVCEFAGSQIGEMDIPFCEAFDDELLGKDILNAGIPKGKFPRNCPVKANEDYVISKYVIPSQKIPAGLPDGAIHTILTLYEPGKDPYVTVTIDGQLSHQLPGLGR